MKTFFRNIAILLLLIYLVAAKPYEMARSILHEGAYKVHLVHNTSQKGTITIKHGVIHVNVGASNYTLKPYVFQVGTGYSSEGPTYSIEYICKDRAFIIMPGPTFHDTKLNKTWTAN
jgi:hypothetical protein